MGAPPAVSVVIPTYDRAAVLPRAIDSVLGQTVEDLELLVVDDGSTDRAPDVVAGYADDRVRCLRHEQNRGASAARNSGIEAASGDYVAFLDSDDEWLAGKLETQLAVLEAASDDVVAVYCTVAKHRQGSIKQLGERLFPERTPDGGPELLAPVLARRGAFHLGSTLLVRRAVVDHVAFDETLTELEDLDLLVRLLQRGRLLHVPETLAILHESDYPEPETVRRAQATFLAKHRATIADLDADGRRIAGAHDVYLAKAYLRNGAFGTGIRYLAGASVTDTRQLAAIAWSLLAGLTATARPADS